MATRIKLRRDTTQNWMDVNPILANGEMGIEADTRRVKIGDGATAWMDLKYAITGDLRIDGKTVNTELGVSIASQDPETWVSTVKARDNWAGMNGICYDSMGNLYMSGWTEYGYDGVGENSSGKCYITKFDSQGMVLWSRYTMLDGYSNGGGVVVDSMDNVFQVTFDWDNDYFVINKFDQDGMVVWQNTYRDGYDYADGFAIAIDSEDNVVVVGRRGDEHHDDNRALFAMKVKGLDGSILWTKTMGGWYRSVRQPCLTIDGSNNIIIGIWDNEYTNGETAFAKLNSLGDEQWSKMIRNPENQFDGYELSLGSLDSDDEGNIYFIGSYDVPGFVHDLGGHVFNGRAGLIMKMNNAGEVQWSRIVGPGDCQDLGAQVYYKNGVVYALFQTEQTLYKNNQFLNADRGYTVQEIVAAAYDPLNGKMLWQNRFGPDTLYGYSSPTAHPENYQYTNNLSGRYIAVHGDYIAIAGQAGDYSRVDDNDIRSYAFLAQLPIDGSEMDLEGWRLTKTKHPSQYAKVKTDNWSNYNINSTNYLTVTGMNEYVPTDTAEDVRIDLVISGANQWDFKPNGDLALPVDGNIEFSRNAQGSINVVGYWEQENNYGSFDYFSSVTTDPEGNRYYVGTWNYHTNNSNNGNKALPMVVKVNTKGEVEWKTRISNTYLYNWASVNGLGKTIAYDPSSGNLVVVAMDHGEGTADQMLLVDMDTQTGDVVHSNRFRNNINEDLVPNAITINTEGERFVTGYTYGPNSELSFQVSSSMADPDQHDVLLVPRSVFAGHEPPIRNVEAGLGWQLYDGSNYWNMNDVDVYQSISGATRQGNGAIFNVTIDSGHAISDVTVANGGSNYRVGHKLVIDHSLVGGTSADGNINIVVTGIDNEINGIITTVTYSYVGAGGNTQGVYSNVNGVNYDVGSGFLIDVGVDGKTGALEVFFNQGGTNYAVGDLVTFSGVKLGGTSPATDLVIKVLQVGGYLGDVQNSGEGTGYEVVTRGVSPLTQTRLWVSGSLNFTTGGPWTLYHYTGDNIFVAKINPPGSTSTVAYAKWIEKTDSDYGVGIDYDSTGSVYVAATIWDGAAENNSSNLGSYPALLKLDSTGAVQWSRTYSYDGHEGRAVDIQVDSEGQVVFAHREAVGGNAYKPVVERLRPDTGERIWQKRIDIDGGEGWGGQGLALDNDDNIYVSQTRYNGRQDVEWMSKIDIMNGKTYWQLDVSHEGRDTAGSGYVTNQRNNSIATDGKTVSFAGFTFQPDGWEGCAIAVDLPADGSAVDHTTGPFSIDETFFGYSDSGGDSVVRHYQTTDFVHFEHVTNRDPLKAWIVPDYDTNFPVYSKADSGIQFADGSVQTTSAAGLPQVRRNQQYKETSLKLSDAGKHVYIRQHNQRIILPTYSRVQFPVGTEITIVNLSGGWLYVGAEVDNYRTSLYCPQQDGHEGSSNYVAGWKFYDNGGGNLIRLLKVEESRSNGSLWIISCDNINHVSRWN